MSSDLRRTQHPPLGLGSAFRRGFDLAYCLGDHRDTTLIVCDAGPELLRH
jgi:hypothetical protein